MAEPPAAVPREALEADFEAEGDDSQQAQVGPQPDLTQHEQEDAENRAGAAILALQELRLEIVTAMPMRR